MAKHQTSMVLWRQTIFVCIIPDYAIELSQLPPMLDSWVFVENLRFTRR